jgi:hypothetical protein
LFVAALLLARADSFPIGAIEFYGYAGLDLSAKRAKVPVHEGDTLSEEQVEGAIAEVKRAVAASSVQVVCCGDGHGLLIYIGLDGQSSRDVPYRAAPAGNARLSPRALELESRFGESFNQAIGKGVSGEDQSRGYALSEDAAVRALQMAMRDYAVTHWNEIRRVSESSSDGQQRATAAHFVGYARQSRAQIAVLVNASRDPAEDVRNNATRALWVLAASSPRAAARIPADGFIEMLYSRSWTDRNKASLLLEVLTRSRRPELLTGIRAKAFVPLLEMARWRNQGHASAARLILGRCAGVEESLLEKLVQAQDPAPLLDAISAR